MYQTTSACSVGTNMLVIPSIGGGVFLPVLGVQPWMTMITWPCSGLPLMIQTLCMPRDGFYLSICPFRLSRSAGAGQGRGDWQAYRGCRQQGEEQDAKVAGSRTCLLHLQAGHAIDYGYPRVQLVSSRTSDRVDSLRWQWKGMCTCPRPSLVTRGRCKPRPGRLLSHLQATPLEFSRHNTEMMTPGTRPVSSGMVSSGKEYLSF